jgi:hypothetical protein
VAAFHCERCTGAVDLIRVDHERVNEAVCPLCLGSVALERRCAGSPHEVADWWQFCSCCGSYWRVEVPEPSRKGQVADWVVGLCEGTHTLSDKEERGKYVPEWFERPDSDCWPGTQ